MGKRVLHIEAFSTGAKNIYLRERGIQDISFFLENERRGVICQFFDGHEMETTL